MYGVHLVDDGMSYRAWDQDRGLRTKGLGARCVPWQLSAGEKEETKKKAMRDMRSRRRG